MMATLTFFTVTGVFTAAAADSIYDVGVDPDLVPVTGSIRFTPLIGVADSLQAETMSPPTNLKLVPITARIKKGVVTASGVAGVRLPANTAVLNIDGDLFYQVEFLDLVARGQRLQIESFAIQAPTSDVVIDLVDVARVAGEQANGTIRGPRGWSVVGGHFTAGNLVLANADGSQTSGIAPSADGSLLFINNGDGSVSVA